MGVELVWFCWLFGVDCGGVGVGVDFCDVVVLFCFIGVG